MGDRTQRSQLADPDHQSLQPVHVGDIENEGLDNRAAAAQFVRCRFNGCLVEVDQHQGVHQPGEPLGDLEAHPTAGSGDDAYGAHRW